MSVVGAENQYSNGEREVDGDSAHSWYWLGVHFSGVGNVQNIEMAQ
jgi:hypothetical protein